MNNTILKNYANEPIFKSSHYSKYHVAKNGLTTLMNMSLDIDNVCGTMSQYQTHADALNINLEGCFQPPKTDLPEKEKESSKKKDSFKKVTRSRGRYW